MFVVACDQKVAGSIPGSHSLVCVHLRVNNVCFTVLIKLNAEDLFLNV